ncbi:magnesium and cobalt transport protein CorA [Micromonospora sp. 4G57]|uniref:Magnesium and cobalt transport protein CorA n=1 Tax=Micromonospora sicca TaxID=2202420 RepID=A0ABU5J5Q8_9ACTN|nr:MULTISPECIES: magnesium and cobalt transport protein CorA [unclassified Micromonospora]MDZ5444926.1 magnesium and cobalt transport protein CorA [Micromonospora sp. 4G57]MDZ5487914.1 magnesium and cobalt transport protein CorA [Micromonospora sp. 4G53]
MDRSAVRTRRGPRLPALLGRLLGRPADAAATPAARRSNPDAVVDCAVYVNGKREPGRPHYADAYAHSRRTRRSFVWLGLHEPGAAVMAAVGRTFGLDELSVAQALADGHRPTVQRHGDVTLLVLRTAGYVEHTELTDTSEVIDTGDVMVFLGDRFVITVRHGAAGALAPVREDIQRRAGVLAEGPWAVAYAVCARMVELYLEVSGHLERDLERVEESVFARDGSADIQHIYQLKREVVEFKRAVLPLQAPLRDLVERRDGGPPPALQRWFVDVEARLTRAVDRIGGYDDLLNSILQSRLAQLAVDQNNDMRKIAAWAAIAATQTAVAGIYGMNFAHMPELGWRYGYAAALLLMALAAVTLYRLFRRSGWL